MSHTIENKSKLLARIRRLKGQVEAIERALEAERGCGEVLQLVASVRGAMNGLTTELMEDHIRHHVLEPANDSERRNGGEELIAILKSYLK
jgi:DNA-binding FrmR family transcriptional regulator